MATDAKRAFYQNVKKDFKAKARCAGRPDPYVVALPTFPQGLREAHPQMFKGVFGESEPVPCRIALGELMTLDQSYSCMGRHCQ